MAPPNWPQVIVEGGFSAGVPVAAAGTFILDDPVNGVLDTSMLGVATVWSDLSAFARSGTVSRPASRQQGPLWSYQPGTASVVLKNGDGRFDPDNLSGPYVTGGETQLNAMVPVRVHVVWDGIDYPLFSGFADSWGDDGVNYGGRYAQATVSATDGQKVLGGVTIASTDPSSFGAGETSGARVSRILDAAGWYTGTAFRQIGTGSSAVQATTFGDTAWNLMKAAADAEIGELYIDGSGAVVFRGRTAILTDDRSATPQQVFGDLIGATGMGTADGTFESGIGDWTISNATLAQSAAWSHSGTFSALMTSTGTSSPGLGVNAPFRVPVVPGQSYSHFAWLYAPSGSPSAHLYINWYDSSGTYISTSSGDAAAVPADTDGTLFEVDGTAPGNAATASYGPSYVSSGAGVQVYADDVFIWPGAAYPAAAPQLPYASASRVRDDTTLANDIQAQRTGGTLQEVQDAASIAKYLFPRTYSSTSLILQDDPTTLNWAQWVLYVAKADDDRFDQLVINPLRDPVNLWPEVLGRQAGDRIQVWRSPPGVGVPVVKDCFIKGISHAWDVSANTWQTTWTLQDASKYGSFMTLDSPVLGQLDENALAFLGAFSGNPNLVCRGSPRVSRREHVVYSPVRRQDIRRADQQHDTDQRRPAGPAGRGERHVHAGHVPVVRREPRPRRPENDLRRPVGHHVARRDRRRELVREPARRPGVRRIRGALPDAGGEHQHEERRTGAGGDHDVVHRGELPASVGAEHQQRHGHDGAQRLVHVPAEGRLTWTS